MIQDGETLSFLGWSTPRNPRKGFRLNEITTTEFNTYETGGKKAKKGAYDTYKYPWVWQCFNPSYTPFRDALIQLQEGDKVGVPISRVVGLYTLPNSVHPLVAYKRWTIGYVVTEAHVRIFRAYTDYEGEIHKQTGAEVTLI